MAGKKQWHPVFAELLRPLVESHFEVRTDVAVGDRPRQADVVLLRRTRAGSLASLGLWSRLTPGNALEYKGRPSRRATSTWAPWSRWGWASTAG